ncbi:hypothetical protein [Kitasatospora sp. NPDC001225]
MTDDEDGENVLVRVEDGLPVCEYGRLVRGLPQDAEIVHYRDKPILPGLVSCHVHYVQTRIITAHGKQLMNWLDHHIHPEEKGFSEPDYARAVDALFLRRTAHHEARRTACTRAETDRTGPVLTGNPANPRTGPAPVRRPDGGA